MILDVFVGEQAIKIEIPESVLNDAGDFFDKMDRDMDKGWKIGPTYVECPDATMRAQIAADTHLPAHPARLRIECDDIAGVGLEEHLAAPDRRRR